MAYTQTYQAFEPAIWSPRVFEFFKMALQAKYVCTDYSESLAGGGNIVYVPNITDGFSATQIVTTTGEITPTNLGDTKSTITLNQWWGNAFRITKAQAEKIGAQYNLAESYFRNMAYTLAKKVDSALFSNITSAHFTVGESATSIPSTTMEHAIQIASSESWNMEDAAWVLTPKAYWGQLAGVAKYYTASTFGKATIPTGFVDILYGVPVLVSNNLPALVAGTGRKSALIHKRAIGYIMGSNGVELTVKETEALRRTYFADVYYGHTLLDSGSIVSLVEKT